MGYNTDFSGSWKLNRPLDPQTEDFLDRLATNRLRGNDQPKDAPEYSCDWVYNAGKNCIEWSGAEKTYGYVEWIEWIIERVLKPKGYSLSGDMYWWGEDREDMGLIEIRDNGITIKDAVISYRKRK